MVGNTYIIDTSSGNTALPWFSDAKVQAISFWGSGTTSIIRLSGSDTTNIVATLAISQAPTGGAGGTDNIYLGGVSFSEMKVPTLTAGTAWIYFV